MKTLQNNWPEGLKRTKNRESVLSVLEGSEKPLSALDIFSQIEKSGTTTWLSTVYRILEIFVKKGVAIKTNVINNEMAVYELNRFNHKHFAVCMSCHKIIAMNNCPMDQFIPKLEDKDFQIMGHNLEVYGLCGDCAPK
ncbi:transcriptional repressor [Desulfosporosinus sp. PR]|uniref:Fur family transcriptional regulator n=1 Tax=Candidatus Desulfosporosinus nitrosoreducens TaxID=3401928 RepID=UPI0027EB6116|nr:transcriptional repressor [Desulfosporosinus sp. PR]MDQ7093588.1 transcriptional repressor [Desulfosporosinus sp. PR]